MEMRPLLRQKNSILMDQNEHHGTMQSDIFNETAKPQIHNRTEKGPHRRSKNIRKVSLFIRRFRFIRR